MDTFNTNNKTKGRLTTGLGQEFDDFINALRILEKDAATRGLKGPAVLSVIRKLLMSKLLFEQKSMMFNWDRIFPNAADISIPDAWAVEKDLAEAAAALRKTGSIRIGD